MGKKIRSLYFQLLDGCVYTYTLILLHVQVSKYVHKLHHLLQEVLDEWCTRNTTNSIFFKKINCTSHVCTGIAVYMYIYVLHVCILEISSVVRACCFFRVGKHTERSYFYYSYFYFKSIALVSSSPSILFHFSLVQYRLCFMDGKFHIYILYT
jgi:hypothetical protein